MKTLRYLFALLCLATASLVSAQVVEFHVNGKYHNDGQAHVHKFYLSQIDSIVYVPALDWTPTIEIKGYYQDEQEQVHVRVHATTGPDADFARLYLEEKSISTTYFYDMDEPGKDTLTNYTAIEKGSDLELDFVVPDPTKKYWFTLATACQRYFPKGYVYFHTATCAVNAATWMAEREWKTMGMGQYTDDLIGGIFSIDHMTYEVEVLNHIQNPGLYRLKNAYGANYPYNTPGDWDTTKDYYLEIDATDPTAVTIAEQQLGLDWGYGMISIKSVSPGTLENGIITFPKNAFYVKMAEYNNGNWSFYGNENGAFKLVLPGYGDNAQSAPRKSLATEKPIRQQRTIRKLTAPSL